jgi:microcystin-dependent protein
MSRGINLYKVKPTGATTGPIYNTKENVILNGGVQYNDIILEMPLSYTSKFKIWQLNDSLTPIDITDTNYTFTDDILTNITAIRKAHSDDYRTLINTLKINCASKFGDTLIGDYNIGDTKLIWNKTGKAALYINTSDNKLTTEFSTSIDFNSIDGSFTKIATILSITPNSISITKPVILSSSLSASGNLNVDGNTRIGGTLTIDNGSTASAIGNGIATSGNINITNGSSLIVSNGASASHLTPSKLTSSIVETDSLNALVATITEAVITKMKTTTLVQNLNAEYLAGTKGDYVISHLMPPGTVLYYTSTTPPNGFLIADGSDYLKTDYPDLAVVLGTTFGTHANPLRFILPNLLGEFIRCLDMGAGKDIGRQLNNIEQMDMIRAHQHPDTTPTYVQDSTSGGDSHYYGTPGNSGAFGGAETRPRNMALVAIIKY